jgi:hypothetical protein
MPDYRIVYDDEADKVTFINRHKGQPGAEGAPSPALLALPMRLAGDTRDAARRHAPGWDIDVLEEEWREWVHRKNIEVKDPDGHFLSFCKTRGPYRREA